MTGRRHPAPGPSGSLRAALLAVALAVAGGQATALGAWPAAAAEARGGGAGAPPAAGKDGPRRSAPAAKGGAGSRSLDLSLPPPELDAPPGGWDRPPVVAEDGGPPGGAPDRGSAIRVGEARLDATIRPTHRRFSHEVPEPSRHDRPDSIGLRLKVPFGEPAAGPSGGGR
jgi:hypothetical protein